MAGYVGPYKGPFTKGANGKDCAAVKRCLKRLQHNEHLTQSREFGEVAVKELRAFQKHHKLMVDGVYGPKTHATMAPLMRGYEVLLYKQQEVRESLHDTWYVLAPGADRPGVSTHQKVKDFVTKVAHLYGHPLVITTGTNHNQYVLGTNHESAHWQGNAADVGMYGSQLTRLGQCALRAAGMPAAEAARAKGGVYNVGGWNILFNTTVGGNHYNHCHMGTT
jgi:hypothetical protein